MGAPVSPAEPWPRAVEFGRGLRELRGDRSLAQFGVLVEVSTGYLSLLERGLARPSRSLVARVDDVCQAGGRLLEAFPLLLDEWAAKGDARRERARQGGRVPSGSGLVDGKQQLGRNDVQGQYDDDELLSGQAEARRSTRREAVATKRRVAIQAGVTLVSAAAAESSKLLRIFEQSNAGRHSVDDLEAQAWSLAEHGRALPPVALLQRANDIFMEASNLLEGRQSGRQRARLELLAGQLSWYRAESSAFGLGDFLSARRHLLVMRAAGELLGHHLLLTAAAELESAIAFYRGDYATARDAARKGQRWHTPYMAARLAMCEARACASLGEAEGVAGAVTRARVQLGQAWTVELGAPLPFGEETFAMYESLAAVRIGDERAEALSREAVHRYELLGSRADTENMKLARLNLATALAKARRPNPDQAAHVGTQALAAPPQMRKETVRRRGGELWEALRSWHTRAAVRDFGEVLRGYHLRKELPSAPKSRTPRRAE